MIGTKTAEIDQSHPREKTLRRAVKVLDRGGVVCFPTETVYGLGVKIFDEKALSRLFFIKGRDAKNPFSFFLGNVDELDAFAENISPSARRLIDEFMPGPLTLIFRSKLKNLSPYLLHRGKVGIRISSSPLVRQLVAQLGQPVTATSANISGKEPCISYKEAKTAFWGKIDLILDGGEIGRCMASTVVDVSEEKAVLIREGCIPKFRIGKALRQT